MSVELDKYNKLKAGIPTGMSMRIDELSKLLFVSVIEKSSEIQKMTKCELLEITSTIRKFDTVIPKTKNCPKYIDIEALVAQLMLVGNAHDAAGLAASQIGFNVKLGYTHYKGEDLILINTKILKSSGQKVALERSLSFSQPNLSISRPTEITIENTVATPDKPASLGTYKFKKVTTTYTEYDLIRRICHIVDFMDEVPFMERKYAKLNIGRNDPCPKCEEVGVKTKWKRCKEHNEFA